MSDAIGSVFSCRAGCGACCVEISISSPMPGLPNGKPAGDRCPHLDDTNRCSLFFSPERPAVCHAFQADLQMCGDTDEEAYRRLRHLERLTGYRIEPEAAS